MGEVPLPHPPLRDQAVYLRTWRRSDVPAIVAACQDPEISCFSPVIPRPYTEQDALTWLEGQEPMRLAGDGLDLAVVHAESNELLGAVGIGGVSMLQTAAIGYWLGVSPSAAASAGKDSCDRTCSFTTADCAATP
jgi:RimJ/RimL family protein N-acetyltransferase